MFLFLISCISKIHYSKSVKFIINYLINSIYYLSKKIPRLLNMDKRSNSTDITSQLIVFKPEEKQYCFDITDRLVRVVGSTGKHDHGSSKVKLKNVVDYKWEQKNYLGRLIAVHLDGKHIAYRITVNKLPMIRIAKVYNAERSLIKGLTSEVLDLQFAHIENHIILGCIEESSLHVYKIISNNGAMTYETLIKINDPIQGHVPKFDKINWCPYVPEDKDDVDELASQLLVWVRGKQFQYYSVNTVINNYGIGTHNANDIKEGTLKYSINTHIITGATFSPDGTTLAVSSEDGVIRFYQVYLHADESNPRCLHEWTPHNGKPISCLFFLDNHLQYNADNSLWKHAITGADNNTEIKLWSCETWECTQTIIFDSRTDEMLNFKIEIDRTSSYLVLNDMHNRGLYVLQIVKMNDGNETNGLKSISGTSSENKDDSKTDNTNLEPESNTNENIGVSYVYINSIAEFPLSSPILGFEIANAAVRRYKCGISDNYLLDELEEYDEDNSSFYCIVIKMYIVQPKSLQECHVLYQQRVMASTEVKSSVSFSENLTKDEIVNLTTSDGERDKIVKIGTIDIPSAQKMAQPNLLTPNSFNSSGKKSPETVSSDVMYTLFMLANATSPDAKKKSLESINLKNMINSKVLEEKEKEKIRKSVEMANLNQVTPMPSTLPAIPTDPNIFPQPPTSVLEEVIPIATNELIASGGSSPSREVQKILSLKDSDCLNEYFDDSDLLLDDTDAEGDAGIINDDLLHFNKEKVKNHVESDIDINQNSTRPIETDWPKVPDVPHLLMGQVPLVGTIVKNVEPAPVTSKQLDQMIEIMQAQSCQIEDLRTQVMEMHKNQEQQMYKTNATVSKMDNILSKIMEEFLVRYEKQHDLTLETMLATNEKQNQEFQEQLLHSVKQITLETTTLFVNEMNRHVLPLVNTKMDAIKDQIQTDVSKTLTTSDKILKDTIYQFCCNENFMDVFGKSLFLGVQNGIQMYFADEVTKRLIPEYEKCTKELFVQIRQTFIEGTSEFSKQFEHYISQFEVPKLNGEEILEIVQLLPRDIKKHNDNLVDEISNKVSNEMTKIKDLESKILKTMKDNIKLEIENSFANQTALLEDSVLSVVRSQVQTPAPSIYDVQEQIKTFLSQCQVNKAFHQALLANDLNLVEFTIERADYKSVFNPCTLEQTVLLSLIQQITADMSHHNELKQKYLSEAILNLDFRDPITKEHAPKVMKEIYSKCQDFLIKHPTSSFCSGIKMLIMAVQGMGFKPF